jgi:isoleucyl-tRNA synthetase
LALCVNPDFVYVKIHDLRRNAYFIVQEDLLAAVYKGNDFVKIHEFKGSELGGWKYTPMFDYYFDEVSKHYLLSMVPPLRAVFLSIRIALSELL